MALKSLADFNADRQEQWSNLEHLSRPCANGIACPTCSTELFDTAPMVTLTSNPPKKDVHCPSCGFRGYRIAP